IPEDSCFSFWRIIQRIFFLVNFIVDFVFGSTSDIGNTFGTVQRMDIRKRFINSGNPQWDSLRNPYII
ncbi:MAG: hypothetical protein WC379_17520, partial [Methanoregula sp.]